MGEEQFGKGCVKVLSNGCQKDVKRKRMFVTIFVTGEIPY